MARTKYQVTHGDAQRRMHEEAHQEVRVRSLLEKS